MFDLYECQPILRMPSPVRIRSCVCGEDQKSVMFAIDCDNYHILCLRLNKSHLNCDFNPKVFKDNVIIRQISVDRSKGEVCSMAFSPNASHLMVIISNANIFIVPVQRLLNSTDNLLKDDATVIVSCSLSLPTSIVWWNSLDDSNQTAIVGNDFGEISFINLKTKKEIGGTYVQNSVKKLELIDDKSSVSLIISCKNNSQFRLILEENRSKKANKNRYESRLPKHEHYYFNCFITTPEEREPIGPNNCWDFKPTLINLFGDNEDKNETIRSTLVYQKPLVLYLMDDLSENKKMPQMNATLFINKEFDYNIDQYSAKFLFPKEYGSQIQIVLLTDRLFFVSTDTDCTIISREFADSRKIAKLNPFIQKFSFEDQVIDSFKLYKSSIADSIDDILDSFLVITNRCVYVCHQKQTCHQLFHSTVTSGLNENYTLVRAQRFSAMIGLNMNRLYEKSAISCIIAEDFWSALRFYRLAKTSETKRVVDFVSFGHFKQAIAYIQVLFSTKLYEIEEKERIFFGNIAIKCLVQQLLESSVKDDKTDTENVLKKFLRDCLYYNENLVLKLLVDQSLFSLAHYCARIRSQTGLLIIHLLESSQSHSNPLNELTHETNYRDLSFDSSDWKSYLNCLTSPEITYSLILNKHLISKYLRFIIKLLPNLETSYLYKLATVLDPRRSATQLLLSRVLTQLKQTYLTSESIDRQIIQRKDILNLFILITLMILKQNDSIETFDEKFVSIDSFVQQIESSNKKQRLIETVGLSAGFSHSAYVRNGCLYVWGKSQFGCCGLQSDANMSKLIPNPVRLDFFKEVVSISVKSVSCGAQHTLVLTDFGVYAFGSSRFGQLGLGKDVLLSRNPVIINELVSKDIVRVECGQYHSLAISASGLLYTWGWNLFGQLGVSHVDDAHSPQLVSFPTNVSIVQAFAGFAHTIALDSNGFIYAFGNGTYGQLGVGVTTKHTIPQKIDLMNEPISQIVTKYFHSLALSRDNQTLYIWGTNPHYIRLQANSIRKSRSTEPPNTLNTNLISLKEFSRPTKVDISGISSRITKICVGSLHSLLLTSNGDVYAFGKGMDGQLGHEKVKDLKIPTKIMTLDEIHIIDIAVGSDYSLVLDISGCVWGFGNNSEAQIGPKRPLNSSSNDEKTTRISIKTNRRLIRFLSRSVECIPIRIPIIEDIESYCESLNYSLDINAMKTSTRFTQIDDNFSALSDENPISFDRNLLALLLAFYRQELDFYSILNRFKGFKCYQMTAFVYEIQTDFPNALDFQLQALQQSVDKKTKRFTDNYTKLFSNFVNKTLDNIEKLTKIISIFIKFWIKNEFEFECLETFLEDKYKNQFKDSMFGISFFNYLKHNQNVCNRFKSSFLLEILDFTIKCIAKRPEKLFSYQSLIERISSDIEEISFPSEKLWQNILTYFRCNKSSKSDGNISVEIEAIDEEIVVFNCSHFYGLQDLKTTIVPNLETYLKKLNSIDSKEIQTILDLYNIWDKEVWDCVCPQCLIDDFSAKSFLFS